MCENTIIEKNYLTIDEVNQIVPHEKNLVDKIERSIYRTVSGEIIGIVNSRLYAGDMLWYSVVTDYFKERGVNDIYFVCATFGVLVIPIDIIDDYCQYSGWKTLNKGCSYYVHIKIKDINFYLTANGHPNVDVTKYFKFNQQSLESLKSHAIIPPKRKPYLKKKDRMVYYSF